MWGVLANYGDIATFSVEMFVRFKLICPRKFCNIQLTGILSYFGNGKSIVVRPLDKIYTSCCILYRLYDFTLQQIIIQNLV